MKRLLFATALLLAIVFNFAQATTNVLERPDAIWARATTEAITLDGKLTEAAWNKAEWVRVKYGETSDLLPGSGYRLESGVEPNDPTDVTYKFLVNGNKLYMAAIAKDKSVGGGLFNQFDGFLMNLRNHATVDRPAGSFEYFYGWVTEGWADPNTGLKGASPGFFGWASSDRTVWDAVTLVDGVTNSDTLLDKGYTVEFMFNLEARGYDVTKAEGDIVEFNVSCYDADWNWPMNVDTFSGTRTWLQGPWGNGSNYAIFRIYSKPGVTVNSGTVPEIGPDLVIPNGVNYAAPAIDGKLDEAVWAKAGTLDIRFGDDELRASYPGIGPWRSGQWQPELNSVKAPVVDPGDATMHWFFKDDMLYLGVDVRDQAVWGNPNYDQWDGIRFVINDRAMLDDGDHNLLRRELTVHLGPDGAAVTADYLTFLVDSLQTSKVAASLKGRTTVGNYNDIDEGYQIELAIDLRQLGYPVGLGDGALFISATLFDGDEFANPLDAYGTRTWWMRENGGAAGPAWALLDYETLVPDTEPPVVLERPDAIWARATTEAITLDGKLDEESWSKAEYIRVKYGETSDLLPGSGYRLESGVEPNDPTDVTYKFLVNGNKLYMAAIAKDKSVGGGLFNQFDGFLMNLRNHATVDRPAGSFEYFYGWVTEGWADPNTGLKGASPGFFGWASSDRTVWDAVTLVDGVTNSDTLLDKGYTVEFMFNLEARGYDVTKAEGDIVEFNVSCYDADWNWPMNVDTFSGTRTWLQGPWGNGSNYAIFRIYSKPGVTVNSGTVPEIGPDLVIPNGVNYAAPAIDGKLDEAVWAKAGTLDIRFGDDELRASYPGIGPWRSGQWQPELNSVKAPVVDPGDATMHWFFKDDMLYLGVDVRDQAVWGNPNYDQWDGIRFVINDRAMLDDGDHNLLRRELTVHLGPDGAAVTADYLTFLVDSLQTSKVAASLKGRTTVGNYNDIDEGYQIELAIDLRQLGYPVGLGDGALFISATLFDGDEFANPLDAYGTRTWWMRENGGAAGPAVAYMDRSSIITGVKQTNQSGAPTAFALLGNYPNPFNPSTNIRYTVPQDGTVTLHVYNVLGREILRNVFGMKTAGSYETNFNAQALSSGVYFYRLEMVSVSGKKSSVTSVQKMLYLK